MNQLLRDAKEFCLPVWWSCQRDRIVLYVQTAPQFENGSIRKRVAYSTYSIGNALLMAKRLLNEGVEMSVAWFNLADLWEYKYTVELSPLLNDVRSQAEDVCFPSSPRWEAYMYRSVQAREIKDVEETRDWWDSPSLQQNRR